MRTRREIWARAFLLAMGAFVAGWLVWRSDPTGIWRILAPLGGWAPLLLCPYGVVYLLDTLGWRCAFGSSWPTGITFGRLIRIRWAGESINAFVPSGYVGGEAIKVYLLGKAGVSRWVGTTSVIVSKTVQTFAQVLFIAMGASLGAMRLPIDSPFRTALWVVASLAGAVLGFLLAVQYAGFFQLLNRLGAWSKRCRAWFQRHGNRMREVDQGVRSFYGRQPKWFACSTAAYLGGWLADSLEIWLVSTLLGWEIDWPRAVAIEAFIGVSKALGAFIPASLGVQESGVVLLFRAFGLTSSQALAYALLRRGRELVYALVGAGLLWTQQSHLKLLKPNVQQEHASAR